MLKWAVKKLSQRYSSHRWATTPSVGMLHQVVLESIRITNGDWWIDETSKFFDYLEQPAPFVYHFPLFSEEYCDFLMEISDSRGAWAENKVDPYTAYEQKVAEISPMLHAYHKLWIVDGYLSALTRGLFMGYEPEKVVNHFLIKYQSSTIRDMGWHHDEDSLLSVSVNLNDDFEGSGLGFIHAPGKKIVARKGWGLMFAGNPIMRHRAYPLTKGSRYVMVYWLS